MMPRIAIIGDSSRTEFRAIVDFATSLAGSQSFPTICAAIADPQFSHTDLIVVLESQPDEYSTAEIESLFAASPLARIVCCCGQWSESAGRTRKIWPVALRVLAVAAVARLEHEWELITGADGEFYLPATGNREETFAANHAALGANARKPEALARVVGSSSLAGASGFLSAESWKRSPPLPNPLPRGGGEGTKQKIVCVISPDADYRAMLVDLLRNVGCEALGGCGVNPPATSRYVMVPVSMEHGTASTGAMDVAGNGVAQERPSHPIDVVIWDADPWHVGRAVEVQALAETMVVVAVSGWITPQMKAELFGAGARVVVPKLGDQMRIVSSVREVIANSQATANR